jgi:hypothetical protein
VHLSASESSGSLRLSVFRELLSALSLSGRRFPLRMCASSLSLSPSFVSFSHRLGISSSRRSAILILHRVLFAINPRSLMRFPRRIASKQASNLSSSSCFLSARKVRTECEEINVVESSEHEEFHSLRRRK